MNPVSERLALLIANITEATKVSRAIAREIYALPKDGPHDREAVRSLVDRREEAHSKERFALMAYVIHRETRGQRGRSTFCLRGQPKGSRRRPMSAGTQEAA